MEAAALAKEEDRVQSSGGDHEEEAATKKDVLHKGDEREQRIKMTKAEMRQVREENERLKVCLDQIVKDYESLKRQFEEMSQNQREGKKSTQTSGSTIHDEFEEVEDMVSLTLGRFSTNNNKISSQTKLLLLDHKTEAAGHGGERNNKTPSNDEHIVQSPADQEDAGQTWPPSKASKPLPPAGGEDDQLSQQNPPKKVRVCVRARCDTPTMNDGCQWRKYGQKIAKGNPCPRAYYRCTGAPSCPVRKQVQRSIDDISILITTYEGTHNHPLPVSAMAMASTTSAAASMLLSGPSSSTSQPGLGLNPLSAAAANHLYLSNNSNNNPKQLYLPNSSLLSSNSLNHPTITLDLTSTSSSSSSPFHKNIPSTYPPKYPFTSLDFGSSQSNLMSWNNGGLIVNNNQPYNNLTKNGIVPDLTKQLPLSNNIYQACLPHMNKTSTPPTAAPDTIAAATKAITSDPNFQSALVAALSSIMGGGGGGPGNGGEMSSYVCASSASLLSKTPSGKSSQQGSMGFQAPAAPSSLNSKTPSSSPGDSRDNNTK